MITQKSAEASMTPVIEVPAGILFQNILNINYFYKIYK